MICKLCLQNKLLLKKSHIVPTFMHKGLFDNKHFLYKTNSKNLHQFQKLPSGEYESNILCEKCDNEIIGGYEDYASKVIYEGRLGKTQKVYFENRKNIYGVKMTHCKGVNYAKFKLFLLSFLWKASVSQRKFFELVDLGPYQENIRKMLFNNDPKEPMDFPCLIGTYKNIKYLPDDLISQPEKYRNNDLSGYAFLVGGFLYIFLVSNKSKPEWISEVAINKNNEISIIHMDENTAKNIINRSIQIELIK